MWSGLQIAIKYCDVLEWTLPDDNNLNISKYVFWMQEIKLSPF